MKKELLKTTEKRGGKRENSGRKALFKNPKTLSITAEEIRIENLKMKAKSKGLKINEFVFQSCGV